MNQYQPTAAEALQAIQAIERSDRLFGWIYLFAIASGVTIALYMPWILVALVAALVGIAVRHDAHCTPERIVLTNFAKSRNWFLTPQEVLRHVEGFGRRKRFYADPVTIVLPEVIRRIKSGDIAPRPAPPKGEVPRKTSVGTGDGAFEQGIQPAQEESRKPTKEASERARAEEEARQRTEEAPKCAEADKERRRCEEARQRAEQECRRAEEVRKRAEEIQRQLQEPRFRVYDGAAWTDLISIKEVWHMMEDGKITLANYGIEMGSTVPKPLSQFPDLAALFIELVIANKEGQRRMYSRDRVEKEECIQFHGTHCTICGFSFEHVFGEIGEGYIEVHHLKPVADYAGSIVRIVNPIADLRPVCANCHRMLHVRNPPYSIQEMIQIRSSRSIR